MIGNPFEYAIPLQKPRPILKPVNEPGPMLTANASISLMVLFELSRVVVIKLGSFSL